MKLTSCHQGSDLGFCSSRRTPEVFPKLALGKEDPLRPSAALMVSTMAAVPGNSNSVNTEYVKYDITTRRGVSKCHISGNI